MAYTTIKKSTDYFNTKLYDGTGSVANVTGVGFQPDFTWIKRRNDTRSHFVTDAVRGAGKQLKTNLTGTETSYSGYLNSFISDGFTLGTDGDSNDTGGTYASWNWLASNTTASNTNGSITSTVSANTTSGFSIVSYTGTGSAGTIGHGLGSVPKMIIVKNRDNTEEWKVYHASLGATLFLRLNSNTVQTSSATYQWNGTTPTSSVFSVGEGNSTNTTDYIAYCFAEVKGFSKFGSYTGNGNADGTFVYTGFKPSLLIVKRTDDIGGWKQFDNKRNTFNSLDKNLSADSNAAEDSGSDRLDFLSNGFKIRTTSGAYGGASGSSIIYMAFAEEPLVGDNPATAR